MANIQALNSLDEALMDSAKSVKPLYYIEPVNAKESGMKNEQKGEIKWNRK